VAAQEGRYQDALREYVWFHEHALEHERAFYGVRLSFALAYWMDLGKVYPEARRKLEEIRDKKTETLAFGAGDRELFHDIESINQVLGEEHKTYRLFRSMLQISPLLAATCADLAIEAIVKARNFALAERHSDPPEDALIRYSEQLNEDVTRLAGDPKKKALRLDAYVHIYCDRVGTIIAILRGLKKQSEAMLCREWAELLVESRSVRRRVARILAERYVRPRS
jgi:hypothetical protein